jgi:sialate O-acetylesterase
MPFYSSRLANWNRKINQPGESDWAELQESQLMTLSVRDTEMTVLVDTGEWREIHPQTKDIAGERLARITLAKACGEAMPYSGPIYDAMQIEGSQSYFIFKHLEGGPVTKKLPAEYAVWRAKKEKAPLVRNRLDSELEGFAICGGGRKWVRADAKIDGGAVLVWSENIPAPVAVRYGWGANPTVNLHNRANLPASPFRTDDFPVNTPATP